MRNVFLRTPKDYIQGFTIVRCRESLIVVSYFVLAVDQKCLGWKREQNLCSNAPVGIVPVGCDSVAILIARHYSSDEQKHFSTRK
jgi:hypothetical protein